MWDASLVNFPFQIPFETDLIRRSNFATRPVDRYRGHFRPVHEMGPIDQETNALDNRHLNSGKNHDSPQRRNDPHRVPYRALERPFIDLPGDGGIVDTFPASAYPVQFAVGIAGTNLRTRFPLPLTPPPPTVGC